jgi:D-aminoacyl-tRNA deacylase
MGPCALSDRVRFLVASEADEAGLHQRDELLGLASWKPDEPFAGRGAWRLEDLVLVTIPEPHLYRDHLDRDLESSFDEPADLVIYLSKHRSESGRPSLTVHPIGNPGAADFGGQPETLVPSAARWMTAALRALRRLGRPLPYEVTFEATHHGPFLTSPTFYVEQGSTAREWEDRDASRAIGRALLELRPLDAPIAIGLGGGHYMPRHTDLALRRRIAFGHLLPTHALEKASPAALEQAVERTEGATLAYLHRKALSKPQVRWVEKRLDSLGLRIVREAELPPDPQDETS